MFARGAGLPREIIGPMGSPLDPRIDGIALEKWGDGGCEAGAGKPGCRRISGIVSTADQLDTRYERVDSSPLSFVSTLVDFSKHTFMRISVGDSAGLLLWFLVVNTREGMPFIH